LKTIALLVWLALVACEARAQARPQLDSATAARHEVVDYLDAGPQPWRPQPLREAAQWRADFVVAADGSGTHRTVQAAIDALPARGASGRRHYIRVQPGAYREVICARDKAPFTLYGTPGDPSAALIVAGRYNGLAKRAGEPANPCEPNWAATTHGTSGSASVAIFSDDAQLVHLTIANDATEPAAGATVPTQGTQAVALMTRGDRIQLEDMRLFSHQDTLYVRASAPDEAARVYVHASLVAGDVDFVFGDATLVLERCVLYSRADRRGRESTGIVLAPSTPPTQSRGFLVVRSRFLGDPALRDSGVALGRAWDRGVAPGTWQAGVSPNGQALVRDSELGPHIGAWVASTSRRPFATDGAAANRLAEVGNRLLAREGLSTTVPLADRAREVLGAGDGWAAAEGGTRGGADAAAADVADVHDRAGLVAALAPHEGQSRPRIVRVHRRIDLASDAAGRTLGFEDFRDPDFDLEAYARAFDPGTWGRRAPAGPLEQARQRSARRQAAHTVLRVPSRTTLIGVGNDAAIVGGMLFLENVDNVILRNLRFADAYDHFPQWDPQDGEAGEWNSDYDNVSLRGATHVWVDRCTFDDGDRPDATARALLGRRMQHHDGLLDMTRGSNWITVSWNHLRHHDKTSLVGGSDGHASSDAGRLKVSYHHNLWEQLKSRTPRVRFGQVHLANNLYVVGEAADESYVYSIGIGHESRVISERNAWQTPGAVGAARLVAPLKGRHFVDRGSWLNGAPVDLLAAMRAAYPDVAWSDEVGWTPPFAAGLDPVEDVQAKVRAAAGAGRWAAVPP
jgi:pectin methylesterase-like acyl-CoA thioesterase/pectate lyase